MRKLLTLAFWLIVCTIHSFANTLNIDSLIAVGQGLETGSQYLQADRFWQSGITRAKENKNWDAYLKLGLEKGIGLQARINLLKAKKYKLAADFFHELINQAEDKVAANNENLLQIYRKLGISYYYLLNYPLAVQYFEKELQQREGDPAKNTAQLIRGYYNIGTLYYYQKDYDLAIKYFLKSLDWQTMPPTSVQWDTYEGLSRAFRELGDFDQAHNYMGLLEQHKRRELDKNSWQWASFLLDWSNFYRSFEMPKEAIDYSQQAIEICYGIPRKETQDSITLADAFNNLGNGYLQSGNYPEAIKAFQNSLEINHILSDYRPASIAQNYNNLGYVYELSNQLEEAGKHLMEALKIKKQLNNSANLSSTLNNLGELRIKQKNYRKAIAHYQQAICTSSPTCDSITNDEIFSVEDLIGGDQITAILNLTGKAKALRLLSQQENEPQYLLQAAETYALTSELIDHIRLSYLTDQSKTFLTQKTREIYEAALQTSLELYQQTKKESHFEAALAYSEKSKSIVLLEAVLKSDKQLFVGIDESLRIQELELKKALAKCETNMAKAKTKGDSTLIGQLAEEMVQINLEYNTLSDQIHQQYPEYYELMHNAGTASLRDIRQQLLKRGQALIEYFKGTDKLYVFIIKKRHKEILELPLDFPLAAAIDSMRIGIYGPYIGERNLLADELRRFQVLYSDQANLLYQELFAPLEKGGLPKKLIVVPDGVLGYLPFEALLASPVDTPGEYFGYDFLLRKYEFSYGYSATLLLELKNRQVNLPQRELLAIAPSFNGLLTSNSRNMLGPLHYNIPEAKSIAALFKGEVLQDGDAKKENFLELAPYYRLLHIASHATASDVDPNLNSYIAFAHKQAKLNDQKALYLWELYNLRLHADMVVLSACETGIGQLIEGEGIMSLARAFSYAGAKSVITTLWAVRDKASSDLMIRFYELLKKGKSKSRALTEAKRGFLKDATTANPYFWSGFVAIGNMEPVHTSGISVNHTLGISLLLFLLLLLAGFLWRRRRRSVN